MVFRPILPYVSWTNHLWNPRTSVRTGPFNYFSPISSGITEKSPRTPEGFCAGGGGDAGCCVRARPGQTPFLPFSFWLFIESSTPQSGVQGELPPSRRRPPGAAAAPGARPFPAVCCHLPSAAAGGGSRGAPRKPVTPEEGTKRVCASLSWLLFLFPKPRWWPHEPPGHCLGCSSGPDVLLGIVFVAVCLILRSPDMHMWGANTHVCALTCVLWAPACVR